MATEKNAHTEGAEAGRVLDRSAADCPYLPGTALEARAAWLTGFGETRSQVSPGSDPDHAAASEPDHRTRPSVITFKEG